MDFTFRISRWWLIGIVVVLAIYLALNTRIINQYYNFQEYLKTEIETLKKQNKQLDSTLVIVSKERDKIRFIREKVSIAGELERLEILRKELEAIRAEDPAITDSISPEDLEKYFIKEFKRK